MPKCAIYARVSTSDQKCEMQLTELREFASRMQWPIAKEYVDHGWSGTRSDRPALHSLMRDASLRRFDAVLTWRLDRFGRSVGQLIANIQRLDQRGIRFIVPGQSIDTDQKSPTGRLIINILASVAEFERDLIQERVKAGVAQAKRQGKHCGRPSKIFRRDRALELRGAGESWREIARTLGVPVSTVRRAVEGVPKVSR